MLVAPPKLVCISVGSLCGYRCVFCSNKQIRTVIQPLDTFIKHLESFKTAEVIDISGFGDLLLHPEFEKIVELMTKNKIPFSFITTAENLTPDKQELLRNSSLFRMNISLNSLNPETKKFLSGNCGNFDRVMEHFKEFVKKPRNYIVSISMVVNRYNFRETPDFVRFGVEHGVNYIILHQLLSGIKYPNDFELLGSEEEWEYFNEAHRIAKEAYMPLGGFSKQTADGKIDTPSIKQCLAPWNEVVIVPDGDVIPCSCSGVYKIGNINTQSFEDIWNGEKANELRNAILAGDNKFCKQCLKYK